MTVKLQTKDPAKSLGHSEVCEPPAKQNRHTIASQSPKKVSLAHIGQALELPKACLSTLKRPLLLTWL